MEFKPRAHAREGLPYLRVAILLCPGFTLTAMSGFVDALRLAADHGDRSQQIYFSWDFLAAGPLPLRASCGLEITPTNILRDPEAYECVVVCGGRLKFIDQLAPEVEPFLATFHKRGLPIIGLCTGSFVLARSGLLDGRRCALHFETSQTFSERYPQAVAVTNRSHVIDGNILTCPGGVASAWVATLLISAYSNSTRANKALAHLLMDQAPPKFMRKVTDSNAGLSTASGLTRRAVEAMEFGLDSPCSITELARKLNVSKPSLNRAFSQDLNSSPARFWRRLRLMAAQEMLLGRKRNITEIAYETGFSDTAHFCATFKREFGKTPKTFQQQAVTA
ncbi:GlxA family transcriptional regulator [Paracoccus saliphilus]|uniref:Helix-turn-helix domain-containing protein n=1 Tax=Paracoccus saliphilus TaxID=405559 RepID=A0AA46A6Z6_9RHOB|nr:helix-turn-helix domain-containing protein [Paracoccus saliphilus]WCR03857.1 helix-turn-helix domain-containing protein [Paracoccus saliphilus]SIT05464.1 Transcriptional regulator GlxA family, contains an amidase domain and an AraC-type DNA-binding HTH domain [Paracoccus saliphilus]